MASSVITSVGTVADSPGNGQGANQFCATDGTWWDFHYRSTSTTTLYARCSTDAGATWADPTNNTMVLARTNGGHGTCLGTAYKNIGGTHVVHLNIVSANLNPGVNSHIRATLSGTTITWGTEVTTDSTAALFSPIIAGATAIDSNNRIYDSIGEDSSHGGDMNAVQSSNADSGTAWTTGFAAHTLLFSSAASVTSNALLPLAASGKVMAISDNGAVTGTPTDVLFSLWGGASWSPANPATSIFGSTLSINANDWGACIRTDTDVHAVRRAGANTYTHRRWNGTSWGAGDSITIHTSKASAGVAMVSDGIRVWLFIIDSAAGNNVYYAQWAPGAGWSSWLTLEITSQVRTFITASYSPTTCTIGVTWSQVNGANFDLTFEPLVIGQQLYLRNTAAIGSLPASSLGGWADTNTAATGANSMTLNLVGGTSQHSVAYAMPGIGTSCIAAWVSDTLAAQTIPAQTWIIAYGTQQDTAFSSTDDMALLVMTPAGGVRGTILALEDIIGGFNNITTEVTMRGALPGSSVVCSLGDRLVLEIGRNAPSSAIIATAYFDGTTFIFTDQLSTSDPMATLTSPYIIKFQPLGISTPQPLVTRQATQHASIW